MIEVFIVLLLCSVLAFVFLKQGWQTPRSTQANQKTLRAYERRQSIFVNGAELAFFKALDRYKPSAFHIFTKVRLEDILKVRSGIKDKQKHWQYRGRIKSRHMDYVICDGKGRFICAIELDGSSHRTGQTDMTDRFKDSIFRHAGLTLYRVKTGEDFSAWAAHMWAEIN